MNQTKKLTISLSIFIFIALILTFFSNTIYNYNLPMATVALPGSGKLLHTVTGNSEILYKDSYKIYSHIEGRIDEIYVSENQVIDIGTPIMKIIPEESKIKDLNLNIMKKENEIALSKSKLDILQEEDKNYIRETEHKRAKIDELDSEVARELKIYKDKIKIAEEEYDKIKKIYEIGGEPYSKVLAQENLIESLKTEYAIYMEREINSIKESLVNLDLKRKDISLLIRERSQSINFAQMELESMKSNMGRLNDNIIYAEYMGVINLSRLEKGSIISSDTAIGKIGEISQNYICELHLASKEREKINPNSVVKIKSLGVSSEIKGNILSINKIEGTDTFEVRISIVSSENLSGQSCKITIETSSDIYNILVEKSSVRKDSDGYYIFVLKEEDGLRKKYIVKRVDIILLDSDEKYSAIEGLQFIEPVVVKSDKNIYNGNRVRYEEK